jgi:hypothetical protein
MLEYTYPGSGWSVDGYFGIRYIHTYPNSKNPNILVQHGSPNDCREFFVKSYREKIEGKDAFTIWARKAYCLFTYGRPATRELDSWTSQIMSDAEKSVYIINSFEKAHGWPLTKVYPVECTNVPMPLVFFAGPRKWTTSPYLMSIWSLCIRLGRNKWLPKKLLTLNHENLVRQIAISAAQRDGGDAWQLSTIRKWDSFLTLYKDLFAGNSRKYHWDIDHLHGRNDRPEGIMMLLDKSTGYRELSAKYYRLKKEKKLK